MKPCPRIVTFESADGPGASRWCARFWGAVPSKPGKSVVGFLPMIFDGTTEAAVVEAAREWWRVETEKTETRDANLRKAREARIQRAATVLTSSTIGFAAPFMFAFTFVWGLG